VTEGAQVYSKQQLAEMFGVSPHTIRYYRKLGVLPPPQPATGCTASYGAEHAAIMRDIWGRNGLKDTNRSLADYADARAIAAEGA
jgi:DNA-binding transcriptional MerR regulator